MLHQPKTSGRLLVQLATVCLGITGLMQAQGPPPHYEPKPNMSADPVLKPFAFRSIGPAVMMGRLDDIQGTDKDPMLLYIGFCDGAVCWKSTDMGNHWKSLFDTFENESIGAIAIAETDPNIVYVGSGEANNRQSSSIGDGMWGTTDGGKTWKHLGLEKVQSINRVAIDPTNPKIVFVAAPGHLFGPNPDRGLYRTTDGGLTWKNVKFIDENTGFNDVAIDPSNPKIIYASSFARRRNGWGYNGGGATCGMWKSVDGGNTWAKLDGPGWPKPKDGLYGRIAISIFKAKPTTLYVQVEAGAGAGTGSGTAANGGPEAPRVGGGGGGGFGGPAAPPDPNGNGVYRSDDAGKTWTFVSNQNQRPTYFSQIRVDPKNVNKLLVGGTPGQMSLDGGKTWKGLTGSHVDYHAIWINPADTRIVAIGHDGGLDISFDGGFTWDYHNDIAAGQFYQVSADNRHPYHVCGGLQDNAAWCAPSALRGTTGPMNNDWYSVAGGDGFYTRQDPIDWTIVYAESQDGEMARHDLKNGTQKSIRPSLAPPTPPPAPAAAATAAATPPPEGTPATKTPPPDEGAAAQTRPATPAAGVATPPAEGGAPAAGGGRRGQRGGAAAAGGAPAEAAAGGPGGGGRGAVANISNPPKDVQPLRFYWNAPFEISPFDPAVIYMAGQYVFKSINRGDSWTMTSKDLSKNLPRWAADRPIMGVPGDKPMVAKHDGYATSSMATQLRLSPSKPGIIWVGTDDGNLQVSQDDGETFTNVYGNLPGAPQGYVQISRIEPSHFDPGTAYVAIDNHRNDDWAAYLYKTTDYGKTFTNVTANLPPIGNINALREDLENPNLLFVGTEFGMYVSLDGSKTWQKFMNGMPSVRVDDILIHPRDRDLIVATHGRSIFIMDDISPLEHMNKTANADLTLFEPRPAILWKNNLVDQRHGANRVVGSNREFIGANPQGGTAIHILSKTDAKGKVEFLQGTRVVSTMNVDLKAGLNRFQWNMRGPAPATGNANARPGGGGGGRGEMVPTDPNAPPTPPGSIPEEVPFVAAGGGGGGGGGGFGRAPQGPLLEPGTYMIRLTVGSQVLTSSVVVLDDSWMTP